MKDKFKFIVDKFDAQEVEEMLSEAGILYETEWSA